MKIILFTICFLIYLQSELPAQSDSTNNVFQNDATGMSLVYPRGWNIIDSRTIDLSLKEFSGLVLIDTTSQIKGVMSIFIKFDNEGNEFKNNNFTNEFQIFDTTSIAYYKDPINQAGFTYYKLYINSNIHKLYIIAIVKQEYFDKYKREIESVVRTIKFINRN